YEAFHWDKKAFATVLLVMTLLTVGRARARTFQLFLLFPIIAASIDGWTVRNSRVYSRNLFVLFLATVLLWLGPVRDLFTRFRGGIGFGVNPKSFPVDSVRFLEAARPEGRLYNPLDYGGYLIAELRRFPVALHGLTQPFIGFMNELYSS